jgi:hypothetical protein
MHHAKAILALSAVMLTAGMVFTAVHAADNEVPLTISGGHDIGRKDFGRPIALIAAALNVKPDVFREAFSGVTPARGGGPSPDEARKNKSALMKVLAPHGVTNDRLDEVSNYYRYQPQRGELWKVAPAKAHAVVVGGKIKSIVVTEPGSGYCNPPEVTVAGFENVPLKVTLHFDTDLKKNGSIASIEVAKP